MPRYMYLNLGTVPLQRVPNFFWYCAGKFASIRIQYQYLDVLEVQLYYFYYKIKQNKFSPNDC